MKYLILGFLLLCSCTDPSQSDKLAAQEIGQLISDHQLKSAANQIKKIKDDAVKDSLLTLLGKKRLEFEQSRLPQIITSYKSIIAEERIIPSPNISTFKFETPLHSEQGFSLDLIYHEEQEIFSYYVKTKNIESESILIECGGNAIYDGAPSFVIESEEKRLLESALMLVIENQDDCTLWLKPFGVKREFTGVEIDQIRDVLEIKKIITELNQASFATSELF